MHDDPTVEMTDEELEELRQAREENLNMLGGKLSRLAQEQVTARAQLETRWLSDLRQYHGEYTGDERARMAAKGGSQVFVNVTRNKTRAAIARISDMLLPNDDTNFGVKPTPVPSTVSQQTPLAQGVQQAAQPPMAADPSMGMGQPAAPQVDPLAAAIEAAEEAAHEMQRRIEDDFAEANYNAHARDVIQDACLLGTGVLKGPTIVNRTRRAWIPDPTTGEYRMEVQEEFRAGLERVDLWDFFPDMSAASMAEAEFCFERKLLNKRQLRDLAKLPGVKLDQLRRALEDEDGGHIAHDRRHDLRAITGVDAVNSNARYELWEYWGPLDKEELEACGVQDIDDDPLVEYTGCVLMVGRHVIKAAINPLDDGSLPYSTFCWEEDPSSIFGFGVPYLMRQPQAVVNASWRMMMDNAGLSAGPQIVVRKRSITPADGDWTLRNNKVWFDSGDEPVGNAFQVYPIMSNQGDLFAIFKAAQELADTETNMPILLQGEGVGGGPAAQTLGGMQMLLNNSNIVLRSAVKNYDDGITVPLVRRFYDFHMAYTDDPSIKGDFDVMAKGTSVLIAREEQQEKLLMLSQVAAQNPIFAELTDWQGLYKEILRTLQLPVDAVSLSDEEFEAKMAQAQEQGGEAPPELQVKMAELELKQYALQFEEQELQLRAQQQEFDQQLAMARLESDQEIARQELAIKQGLTMAELEAKLGLESQKLELKAMETTEKLRTERDKVAATITERQNDRMARRENMSRGFDSYG